jgi:transcriptional regulator with XRE-family HTH domain
MYQLSFPVRSLRLAKGLSERSLADAAHISRQCLRQLSGQGGNITLRKLSALAAFFGREIEIVAAPVSAPSEHSTVAAAYQVERDGFESWKIHFMDLADEFRRSLDPRLVMLPPHRGFDRRLTALLASLVRRLCEEQELPTPEWARQRYFLECPWFVSGMESLKASALLESPLAFRSNNIFVQRNFAERV